MKNKGPKTKHVPMRTCIGTGLKKPKSEMIRLLRTDNGEVKIDLKGKERGRGANLDMTLEAFDMAVKKGAIDRALKLEKKLTKDQIDSLRADFEAAIEEKKFRKGNEAVVIRIKKEDLPSKLKS